MIIFYYDYILYSILELSIDTPLFEMLKATNTGICYDGMHESQLFTSPEQQTYTKSSGMTYS